MQAQGLVFLGGTSGRNPWRKEFIRRLVERGVPRERLFDPVASRWNDRARRREEEVKDEAALLIYYLGDPQEPGIPVSAFALVEAALAVCCDPGRTLLIFDLAGVEGHAREVYEQSEALLRNQDASVPVFRGTEPAVDWIAARFAGTGR